MTNLHRHIKDDFLEAQKVLHSFISDAANIEAIQSIAHIIAKAFNNNKKVVSFGNGGSHCDAMHFAEELTGRYRHNRKPLPAIAISNPSHLSCVANDYGYDYVFSRFIEALCHEGDIALGISTSGNSLNILKAFEAAKKKGVLTVLLTGRTGGKLAQEADYMICVPYDGYADRIQEIHIKIIHSLISTIELIMGHDER